MIKPIVKELQWKQVYNQIEIAKNKLRKKAICENFGQLEVKRLKEKFNYTARIYDTQKERDIMQLIDLFDNWCINYAGENND
jgi:hypothetical protein